MFIPFSGSGKAKTYHKVKINSARKQLGFLGWSGKEALTAQRPGSEEMAVLNEPGT